MVIRESTDMRGIAADIEVMGSWARRRSTPSASFRT